MSKTRKFPSENDCMVELPSGDLARAHFLCELLGFDDKKNELMRHMELAEVQV